MSADESADSSQLDSDLARALYETSSASSEDTITPNLRQTEPDKQAAQSHEQASAAPPQYWWLTEDHGALDEGSSWLKKEEVPAEKENLPKESGDQSEKSFDKKSEQEKDQEDDKDQYQEVSISEGTPGVSVHSNELVRSVESLPESVSKAEEGDIPKSKTSASASSKNDPSVHSHTHSALEDGSDEEKTGNISGDKESFHDEDMSDISYTPVASRASEHSISQRDKTESSSQKTVSGSRVSHEESNNLSVAASASSSQEKPLEEPPKPTEHPEPTASLLEPSSPSLSEDEDEMPQAVEINQDESERSITKSSHLLEDHENKGNDMENASVLASVSKEGDSEKRSRPDEVEELKKEIKEQEHLLKGYQRENERLYSELKYTKHHLKTTVKELKSENEHLGVIVAQLREELELREAVRNSVASAKKRSVSTSVSGSPLHHGSDLKGLQKELKPLKEANENLLLELNKVKEQLRNEHQMVELLRSTVEKKNEALKLKSEQLALAEKKNIMLGDRLRSMPKMATQVSSTTQKKLNATQQSKAKKLSESKMSDAETSHIATSTPKKLTAQSTFTKPFSNISPSTTQATHALLEEQVKQLQKILQTNEAEMKKKLKDLQSNYESLKTEYAKRLEQQKLQSLKEKAELQNKIEMLEMMKLQTAGSVHKTMVSVGTQSVIMTTLESPSKPKKTVSALRHSSRGIQVNLLGPMDFKDLMDINQSLQEKIEELHDQLVKSKRENEDSERNAMRLSQRALQLTKEMETLRLAKEEAAAKHAESEAKQAHAIEELRKTIRQKEGELSKIKVKLHEAEEQLKQMAKLQNQNSFLQDQIKELEDRLFKATENQNLESKQFEALQKKISLMQSRQWEKEKSLQEHIRKIEISHQKALIAEAEKWRLKLQEQYNEVDYFRAQLDSVVEMLEELKRRGVHLPSRKLAEQN